MNRTRIPAWRRVSPYRFDSTNTRNSPWWWHAWQVGTNWSPSKVKEAWVWERRKDIFVTSFTMVRKHLERTPSLEISTFWMVTFFSLQASMHFWIMSLNSLHISVFWISSLKSSARISIKNCSAWFCGSYLFSSISTSWLSILYLDKPSVLSFDNSSFAFLKEG